jgi:hypothetical protein
VSRIKNLNGKNIPLPQNLVNGEKIKTSFDDEFSGKKNITINHSGVAICDHGLVVNSLKELLEEKGAHIANDQLRDLYLFNNGEVEIVFEFKTGFDRQSVYSAIGQLLLNNTTLKPTPKYVMVLPLGLSEEIQSVVRNLNIELLQYEWISDGKVKFLNMEVLDCLR